MTLTLVLALLVTLNKIIDLFVLMISRADEATAKTLIDLWVERETWWQDNIWRPIGQWIEKLKPE